ncbi:MFS transporter [Fodinicola acaciae]|uniref:MFS transporter n=1 Tax=Fodinicola acaciae TaxID=2681555 RepID=UPI0013CF5F65|nr:MFS transporter [Fodinicola acaciae]
MTSLTEKQPDRRTRWLRGALVLAGVLLLAANLRAPLTAVGPVLPWLSADTGLTTNSLGLLNATPLVAFGLSSVPLAAIGRRYGVERVLGIALIVLIAGLLLRSTPSVIALFAGTLVLSVAISAGNVLLPSVVKHHFPAEITLVTGIYAATMSGVAAIGSGVSAPIAASAGGWRLALACWAGIAVLALLLWIPQWRGGEAGSSSAGHQARTPWRSALAWQVTLFMGLQSFGFYVCIGWLPTLLTDSGYSPVQAGFLVFLYQAVSLATYIGGPLLLRKMRSQRAFASGVALAAVVGYVGLIFAPSLAALWVSISGLGAGGCLVVALSFFSLRAANPAGAAALSGMAQSIGYLIAAVGPLIFGALHVVSGGWTVPLMALIVVTLVCAVFGVFAGRDRTV